MTALTAKEIMNWYLYGQSTTPTNLIDDSLIRPDNATVTISVGATTFMADAGRFALGCSFPLVTDFFQDGSLSAGTYTKADLAARYGMTFYGLALQEANLDDGNGDYAERTFVWGSVGFQIADGALFVVDTNGNKRIDNFAVQPLVQKGVATDNFDFSSSNPLTQLGDSLILQPNLDPSQIGRKVTIELTGQVPTTTYTQTDYDADLLTESHWTNPSLSTLYSATKSVEDSLWNSGVTKSLDAEERPIVYGSVNDDILDQQPAANSAYLADYVKNGIVYVGGAGDDTFKDTVGSDVMLGGAGNDTADFSGAGGLSLTIDSGTYNDTPTPTPVVSIQIDGRTGPDLLSSVENILLSGGADTVKIASGADLSQIKTINAGGQEPGLQDTLDMSQTNAGYSIFNSELIGGAGGVDVKLQNFEKVIGSASGSTINLNNSSIGVAIGGAGDDIFTAGGGGDILDAGEGNNQYVGGAGADIFVIGNGADAVNDGWSGYVISNAGDNDRLVLRLDEAVGLDNPDNWTTGIVLNGGVQAIPLGGSDDPDEVFADFSSILVRPETISTAGGDGAVVKETVLDDVRPDLGFFEVHYGWDKPDSKLFVNIDTAYGSFGVEVDGFENGQLGLNFVDADQPALSAFGGSEAGLEVIHGTWNSYNSAMQSFIDSTQLVSLPSPGTPIDGEASPAAPMAGLDWLPQIDFGDSAMTVSRSLSGNSGLDGQLSQLVQGMAIHSAPRLAFDAPAASGSATASDTSLHNSLASPFQAQAA